LFPQLTALVTIDLLGGDSQEAMPGQPLPQPVRIAVRNEQCLKPVDVDDREGRTFPVIE